MLKMYSKYSENLILFALASFVFLSLFGVGIGMEMKGDQMSSCLFMVSEELPCQMSVAEHITKWQQIFLGMPTKTNFLTFVMALLITLLASFIKPFSQLKKLSVLTAQFLDYHRANFAKVFDPLLIAFSDGILNPKIY